MAEDATVVAGHGHASGALVFLVAGGTGKADEDVRAVQRLVGMAFLAGAIDGGHHAGFVMGQFGEVGGGGICAPGGQENSLDAGRAGFVTGAAILFDVVDFAIAGVKRGAGMGEGERAGVDEFFAARTAEENQQRGNR